MNVSATCGQCKKPLPEDAPGGVCPACLMGLSMKNPLNNQTVAHRSDPGYPAPTADELVGKFPNLEIEHLIGHGGMGAVYQARQTNLDRVVALKILSPKLSNDPSFTERFMREARTLAKLSHPNIVMVFDFGQADDMHYLVMEFVDGINLRDAIQTERLNPERALEIVPQICDALQYAHDRNVIHRDIKPENILIDRKGNVKIADFGLAKLLDPSPQDFTLTGTRQVLGTVTYMAPEQIEKPELVDHRADIYSLGVVFYELLTGELPIGRFSLPSQKSRVSNELDEVVMRALEKEPDRRYQQVSQVKTDVQSVDPSAVNGNGRGQAAHREPATSGPSKPFTLALPIQLDEVHGGWSEAYGIARGEGEHLEIEFQIQDALGVTKKPAQSVKIPLAHISSVKFINGLLWHRVEIQADRIDAVSEIPGSNQGMVKLYTKKSDSKLAVEFTRQLSSRLPNQPTHSTPVATPIKGGSYWPEEDQVSVRDMVIVDERLKVPRFGLMFSSLAHFLFISLILLLQMPFMEKIRNEFAVNFGPHKREFIDGDWQNMADPLFWLVMLLMVVASAVACVLFLLAARNIALKRNYHFIIAVLILALLPMHPAAVISIPFALWTLVVMCLPSTRNVFRAEAIVLATNQLTNVAKPGEEDLSQLLLLRTLKLAVLVLVLMVILAGIFMLVSNTSLQPAPSVTASLPF